MKRLSPLTVAHHGEEPPGEAAGAVNGPKGGPVSNRTRPLGVVLIATRWGDALNIVSFAPGIRSRSIGGAEASAGTLKTRSPCAYSTMAPASAAGG